MFELMRGDLARAAPNAFGLARLTREHDLPMWRGILRAETSGRFQAKNAGERSEFG